MSDAPRVDPDTSWVRRFQAETTRWLVLIGEAGIDWRALHSLPGILHGLGGHPLLAIESVDVRPAITGWATDGIRMRIHLLHRDDGGRYRMEIQEAAEGGLFRVTGGAVIPAERSSADDAADDAADCG